MRGHIANLGVYVMRAHGGECGGSSQRVDVHGEARPSAVHEQRRGAEDVAGPAADLHAHIAARVGLQGCPRSNIQEARVRQ